MDRSVMASYRQLDLTLVQAFELRNENIISCTPHASAVATLSDDRRTEQGTPAGRLGGGRRNLTWNRTYCFFIPADVASAARLCIRVLIRDKRVFGDQNIDIGESIIPLKDLLLMDGKQTQPHAAYPIRNIGEPRTLQGFLMISYMLSYAGEQAAAAAPPPASPWSSHAPFTSNYRPPMTSPSRYNYGSYGYGYGYNYPQQNNMSTLQQGRQMQNDANWDSFGIGQGMKGSDGAPGAALGRRHADYTRIEDAYNDWYNNFGMGLGMTGSDGAPGAALGRRFADRTRNMEDAYNAGYVAGSQNAQNWINF